MFESLIAAFVISLLSLTGVFFFGKKSYQSSLHSIVIPIAIGTFLGVIFFELIPETLEGSEFYGACALAFGFLSFYLLAHILRTYHHHHEDAHDECRHSQGASMLLWGDAVHNMADGVVITTAFLINPAVGIATTIGIALHEIPQEIAEYGVFVQAGYSRKKALMYNFFSASSIFIGVFGALLFSQLGDYLWILTGIAAGNLLYIVASDMIPELNQTTHKSYFFQTFLSTLVGLVAIVTLLTWSHEYFGHADEEHQTENANTVELLKE